MQNEFQVIPKPPAPPVPQYSSTYKYVPAEINKHLNGRAEVLEAIKTEYEKYKNAKAKDPEGYLKNITVGLYIEKDPKTGEKRRFPQIYTLIIEGRSEPGQDYYKGRCFKGRIEFPDDYPKEPPRIVLDFLPNGKPIQMVNLYADGEVCDYIINRDTYRYPKNNLPSILRKIEQSLYSPNPWDPANGMLGEYFQKYPDEYWEFQRIQALDLPQGKQS